MSDGDTAEIKTRQRGTWWRVYAEVDERDVSHVSYGPHRFPLGPKGEVRMAGLGGVGTEPEFRRKGLARRVFQRTMDDVKSAGYSCAGLFTSKRIVAHRMYRRFGYVEVARNRPWVKLLDPAGACSKALSQRLGDEGVAKDLARWRCAVELRLSPHPAVYAKIQDGSVEMLSRRPRAIDVSMKMSAATFMLLREGRMTVEYAEAARLLSCEGEAESCARLRQAFGSAHRVVRGG